MIKVLIADDHPIVRQGLRQILSSIPDMEVAGEAVNAQASLDQVRAGGWDVLDITMPDRSGFDFTPPVSCTIGETKSPFHLIRSRLSIGLLRQARLRNPGHLWLTLFELAKANELFLFFIPQA